jgi:tetratricopeptide (TPR) repeat protein
MMLGAAVAALGASPVPCVLHERDASVFVEQSAQTLPGESERDHLKSELSRYHQLIVDYGRGDDVTDKVVVWDESRTRRVLAAIGGPNDDTRPWSPVRFKAAAMMHTDAAVRLLNRAEQEAAVRHLDTAGRLLMKAGSDADPYTARWYRATALLLRTRGLPDVAEKFLETARKQLPRNPTVLYESGALQEVLASDMVLPTVIYLRDLETPAGADGSRIGSAAPVAREDVDDLRRRRMERLNRAAGWLRASLDADGTNMLARLHLGRVQYLRNQNGEALKLLEQASASDDATVAYLAFLFTGAVHERAGLFEAAGQAYRAATERYPSNHAAYIALSALRQRSGDRDDSRQILTRVLGGRTTSRRDPWWTYLHASVSACVFQLDVLRQETRQ